MRQTGPMSPTNTSGKRAGQRPGSSLLPLVAAICVLILIREGFQRFAPGVNYWVAFAVALVVGYAVYFGLDRALTQRGRGRGDGKR